MWMTSYLWTTYYDNEKAHMLKWYYIILICFRYPFEIFHQYSIEDNVRFGDRTAVSWHITYPQIYCKFWDMLIDIYTLIYDICVYDTYCEWYIANLCLVSIVWQFDHSHFMIALSTYWEQILLWESCSVVMLVSPAWDTYTSWVPHIPCCGCVCHVYAK